MAPRFTRFTLVGPGTAERFNHSGPGAVLSKAITRATTASIAGTWKVIEYEDTIYVVERHELAEGFLVTIHEKGE